MLEAEQWPVLARWLDRLPDGIKQRRPQLLLAQAWVHHYRSALWEIAPIIETAEALLEGDGTPRSIRGEIDFFQGLLLYWQSQGDRSLASLQRALDLLPQTQHHARGEVGFHWGLAGQMAGQRERVVQGLTDMLSYGSARQEDVQKTRLIGSLAAIHMLSGELIEAEQGIRRMRSVAQRSHNLYVDVWCSYGLGNIFYQWNDLEKAVHYYEQVISGRYVLQTRAAVDGLACLALTQQALRKPEKAKETLDLLFEFVLETGEFIYESVARSCQAHLSLLQGDVESALRWQKNAGMAMDAGYNFFWMEVPHVTQCRVLIAHGTAASLKEAGEKLRQTIRENEALRNTFQLITPLLLQAQLRGKQGRMDEAQAMLGRAVILGEPGAWIRPFIAPESDMRPLLQTLLDQGVASDYARRILSTPPDSTTTSPSSVRTVDWTPVDLTNREMDVLELLAQRLTNQEIANQLFLSPQTVKNYSIRLYKKLHVNNRRQAVAKARALGILPEHN